MIVWAALIMLMVTGMNFISSPELPDNLIVSPEDIQYLSLQKDSAKNSNSDYSYSFNYSKKKYDFFDPNTLDSKGWQELGFSQKQADVIVNYRSTKGGFKSKKDLKNIFVISDEKYNELEPFMLIQNEDHEPEIQKNELSINLATSSQLESLPLIGEKLAARIIKYRQSLGGFVSMTQLHEVYGLSEDVYQILLDNTELDASGIVKLNINTATKDEIDKHPYIDFDVTAAILKEREKRPLSDLNFLIEKNLITQEELEKIKPYISFE